MAIMEVNPSRPRIDALFRVVLLLVWTWTIWPFILAIGLIAGVLWMLTDVILQLVQGNSGISNNRKSRTTDWLERIFFWPFEQLKYIIGTDDTGFPVLP